MSTEVEELLECRRQERYAEVVKRYKQLSDEDRVNKFVLMAYGDSSYEEGDDLEALRAYLTLAANHPNSKGRNFALFGAAMSLKNLDMQAEAKRVLEFVDRSHSGVERALAESEEVLKRQRKAEQILAESGLVK